MNVWKFLCCDNGEVEWTGQPLPGVNMIVEAALRKRSDRSRMEHHRTVQASPATTRSQAQDRTSSNDGCDSLLAALRLPIGFVVAGVPAEEDGLPLFQTALPGRDVAAHS